MRFSWKVLFIAIPIGGYWLYKKSSNSPSDDTEVQPRHKEVNEKVPQEERRENLSRKKKKKKVPKALIIERLTEIDGVTSRVAENLVEKGIYSREALAALSKDELMEIKGIGPKRAEKILKL